MVIKVCTDNLNIATPCEMYRNLTDRKIVYVKSDNATSIIYMCGLCILRVTTGYSETEDGRPHETRVSDDYIMDVAEEQTTVEEYTLHTVATTMFELPTAPYTDFKADETTDVCGYQDEDGRIVVIFCTYELDGIENTTIVY